MPQPAAAEMTYHVRAASCFRGGPDRLVTVLAGGRVDVPQQDADTERWRFCPSCGTPARPGGSFCSTCGRSLQRKPSDAPDNDTAVQRGMPEETSQQGVKPVEQPSEASNGDAGERTSDSAHRSKFRTKIRLGAKQIVLIDIAVVAIIVSVLIITGSFHGTPSTSPSNELSAGQAGLQRSSSSSGGPISPSEAYQAGYSAGQGMGSMLSSSAEAVCKAQADGRYPQNAEDDAQWLNGCVAGYAAPGPFSSNRNNVGPSGENNISGAPDNEGMSGAPSNGGFSGAP